MWHPRHLSRWTVCLAAIVALCLATGTASAQNLSARPLRLPDKAQLDRFGLERLWWGQPGMDYRQDKIVHLSVDEEHTYVQASSGIVTCFNSETGRRMWMTKLGFPNEWSTEAISNEESVLIVSGPNLYSLERYSGRIRWTYRLPGNVSARPALDEDRVYVPTMDGSIYALSLKTIQELHDDNRLPQWSSTAHVWRYKSGQEIPVPPLATSALVAFASRDNSLYGVEAASRKQLYQFETDAPVSAPMALHNDRLYLTTGTPDYKLYCININNGELMWDITSGLPVVEPPRVIDGRIFLVSSDGGMHYLTADTGERLWWTPNVTGFLAVTRSRVYTSDELKNLVVIDRADGTHLGALPLWDFKFRYANDRTDRIFLATDRGIVVCLREQGREFPVYHQFPERKPILPDFAPEVPEGDTISPPPAEPEPTK